MLFFKKPIKIIFFKKATFGVKIFINYISAKRPTTRMYKELSNPIINNPNNPIKKCAEDMK